MDMLAELFGSDSVKTIFRGLGLSLALLLATQTGARALKPEVGYRALPSHYGIMYDEVSFKAKDGVLLRGWFYPAQDTTGIANQLVGKVVPVPSEVQPPARPYCVIAKARRPTVIICCGDAGNMADLILYAYNLFTHGFNVFTFDWRGFGESSPRPLNSDELVRPEFLLDYNAAIDYVKTRPEARLDAIGLMGFSTGAYLSFAMAATRDDVKALVCRALITSFTDLLSVLAKVDPGRKFYAPKDYPVKCLPINAAPSMRKPTLLVVGEKDDRTPPWMSQKVFQLLKGPKELWIVPGAGHGGTRAPEMVAYDEFFSRVRTFFGVHLGPAAAAK